MNNIIKILCLAACAAVMAGCADTATKTMYSNIVDYLPFQAEKGDKWGMIGTDGKVLFENEFDEMPSLSHNGRFFVKNGDGFYELYTAEKKPKKIGAEYKRVSSFKEDVAAVVEPNKTIDFIDKDGKVKFKFDKLGGKNVHYVEGFWDGIGIVQTEDGLFGCIDTEGNMIIKPVWQVMANIGDGKILAISKKDYNNEDSNKSRVSIIDYKGNVLNTVTPEKMYIYTPFYDGYAAASKMIDSELQPGIINDKCEWTVKPSNKYKEITQIKGGRFVFKNSEDKCGLADIETGETLVRAKYDQLVIIDENRLIAKDNDGSRLITAEGDDIMKDSYKEMYGPFGGNFVASDGDHSYFFVNEKGEPIDKQQSLYELAGYNISWGMADELGINESHIDETVFNDFTDFSSIVGALKITSKGMNGLTMDSHLSDVFTADRGLSADNEEYLSSHVYSNTVDYMVELAGQACNMSAEFGSGNIVEEQAVGFGAYTYELKKDSKLKALKAEIINADRINGKQRDVFKALCTALEKAGWKLEDSTMENGRYFRNGDLSAIVYCGPNAGIVISPSEVESDIYNEIYENYISVM